jgi:anthranilate synthase component 1
MKCKDSLLVYEHLKAINPSPYMYYVVDEDFELAGASPETFIKLDAKTRNVEVKPIAGTRRRGFDKNGVLDPELDARLEAELRLDTKELAEHMMLVDLARNDIARVSELGTRQVQRLLSVERYSHVMHLVSQVQGKLRPEFDGIHAYQASMNMGTLVGAPKIKAAEILRLNETSKRGTYGGAIGYLDAAGNFDTAIIIRSAFIKGESAFVRAGAGVVYDSVPIAEAAETKSKASAVLSAIDAANRVAGEAQ